MKSSVDEDEHSLEMHLPYIRQVFGKWVTLGNVLEKLTCRRDVKLVPLLVGHPREDKIKAISAALSKYWNDDETFFIVSSDFCHW